VGTPGFAPFPILIGKKEGTMNRKLFAILLAVYILGSTHGQSADSLWIVGGEDEAGEMVSVEIWLRYGHPDSIALFDIPLTYDAAVCTVEAITIGADFAAWLDESRIDNVGAQGPPAISKIGVSALTLGPPIGPPWVEGGDHLAAMVDFRILATAAPGNSTCIDTLMQAFSPPIYLGFVEQSGWVTYFPSFSSGCVRVSGSGSACGDCNADTRVTIADANYLVSYIYRGGPAPIGDGDVNVDTRITIADANYLVAYIYRGGPDPCNPPPPFAPFKPKRMER
jgi:hypothetical protein